MRDAEKRTLWLLCRYLLYAVLLFVMYLCLSYWILPQTWPFSANGIIESVQFFLLVLVMDIFILNALIFAECREIQLLLLCCVLIAMAREFATILDKCIPLLGWQAIFLITLPIIFLQFRKWSKLCRQLPKFIASPAMGIFWTALIVIIPLAQCIGDVVYLQAAMQDTYIYNYENLFEESMELYGYLILLCAAFETTLFAKQQSAERLLSTGSGKE